MDQIMHDITLAVPAAFLIGGIIVIVIAVTGKFPERKTNPDMNMTTARIIHLIMAGVMLAIGGWLLYHWIFGPTER